MKFHEYMKIYYFFFCSNVLILICFLFFLRITAFPIGRSSSPSITLLAQRKGGVSLNAKMLSCPRLMFSASPRCVLMKPCTLRYKTNISCICMCANTLTWLFVSGDALLSSMWSEIGEGTG